MRVRLRLRLRGGGGALSQHKQAGWGRERDRDGLSFTLPPKERHLLLFSSSLRLVSLSSLYFDMGVF